MRQVSANLRQNLKNNGVTDNFWHWNMLFLQSKFLKL